MVHLTAVAIAFLFGAGAGAVAGRWFNSARWVVDDEPHPRPVPVWAISGAVALGCAGLVSVLGREGLWPAATAASCFTASGVGLGLVDQAVKRLPEPVVLATYAIVIGILLVGAALSGQWSSLGRAIAAAAAVWAGFFIYSLISGLGFGDVQLMGIGSLILGWIGWGAVLAGAAAAIFIPGLWAALLLARGRRGDFAAGPPIMLGLYLAALVSGF